MRGKGGERRRAKTSNGEAPVTALEEKEQTTEIRAMIQEQQTPVLGPARWRMKLRFAFGDQQLLLFRIEPRAWLLNSVNGPLWLPFWGRWRQDCESSLLDMDQKTCGILVQVRWMTQCDI